MVTPQAGDTLHFFPPGDVFHQYNLPPHQDYQYLMQSPSQITFYMGLSDYKENVGGLRIWEKSHQLGILKSHKNKFGAYEITNYEEALKNHHFFDYMWNDGDFGIFNSLLAHSSIPNMALDASRVVQIFRFSDINNKISESFDYRSTCYNRRSVFFSDVHSDLYL
jgi:ectoine hydroxylase-related dioxygenase (phytanoyl-CoA dioxygenase family)